MTVEIIIRVPSALGRRLQHVHERLPEILERGLREIMSDGSDNSQGKDDIDRLEESARAGNREEFAALVDEIDWAARSPDDLTRAIDLALYQEMASLAIDLAQLGGRLFPDHERLQRAAQVLAPPVTSVSHAPRIKGLRESMAWFDEHAGARQYHGQWIAVRGGKLVGSAQSLDELMPAVGGEEEARSTIVTRVL